MAAVAAAAAVVEKEENAPASATALPPSSMTPPKPQGPRLVAAQWLSPPSLRHWSHQAVTAKLDGPAWQAGAGLGGAGMDSLFAPPAPVRGCECQKRVMQLVAHTTAFSSTHAACCTCCSAQGAAHAMGMWLAGIHHVLSP